MTNKPPGVSGPYIMWKLAGGYDWEPSSYDTFEEALEEALEEASDMQPFVITELKLLPPE